MDGDVGRGDLVGEDVDQLAVAQHEVGGVFAARHLDQLSAHVEPGLLTDRRIEGGRWLRPLPWLR